MLDTINLLLEEIGYMMRGETSWMPPSCLLPVQQRTNPADRSQRRTRTGRESHDIVGRMSMSV